MTYHTYTIKSLLNVPYPSQTSTPWAASRIEQVKKKTASDEIGCVEVWPQEGGVKKTSSEEKG